MAAHQLQRNDWQTYFDRVSQFFSGERAEVETTSLRLGDQINQKWVRLNGLVYDPKDDVFEVVAGDTDHLIPHPQDIYVEETGTALRSVEVIDADGNHQIVKLREPIPLSAP